MANIQRYKDRAIFEQSAETMKLWRLRPKIFIRDVLDVTLDLWQEEVTESYMHFIRTGVIANKGPGKTGLAAMLCLHFTSTNFEPKVACISITKDHLRDNLWAELLKWRGRSETLKKSLTDGADYIHVIGKEKIAFISARGFAKTADESQMQGSLAGLHADNIAIFADEVGGFPDAVLATADAAMAGQKGEHKIGRLVAMGNPEKPSGILYRASKGQTEQEWKIHRVTGDPDDPKRSPRVDIKWARETIATFGRDHPYTKINVFGEYPENSAEQLISENEIEAAFAKDYKDHEFRHSQNRIGVDVARGGADSTVIFRRQGLKSFPPKLVGSDIYGPELAGNVVLEHNRNKIDKVYVDGTGGYGSSVYDSLITHGEIDVQSIIYNARAHSPELYANRRTEMWVRMRDWIRRGGQLPKDDELRKELLAPKIFFHGGKFALEPKEDIKKRLGRSPDRADALAQTFADDEEFSSSEALKVKGERMDYDTMIQKWKDGELTMDSKKTKHYSDYDPLEKLYRV